MARLTIESLKTTIGLSDVQLDICFEEEHLGWLAPHFGNPMNYIESNGFRLIEARKEDVRRCMNIDGAERGMFVALKFWLMQNPFATPRMLLEIMLGTVGVKRIDLISNVCAVLKTLKVKCNSHGCQWVGTLEKLETHKLTCGLALLFCPKGCILPESQEAKKLLRKDLEKHLAAECPKRNHKCELCEEEGEYEYLRTDHLLKCPGKLLPCPNKQCSSNIRRHDLDAHRSICDYEQVLCKYFEIGCKTKPLRKDIKKHEEDAQFHLQIAIDSLQKLKSEQQRVKTGPHIFRIANFKKCKEKSSLFISCPFYTSYTGYKMCLSVFANGHGDGEGTHVSIYAHLMKGDNDDSLTWPFTGSVTFELLNQLEDDNHHERIVTFPADNKSSKRVMDGKQRGSGYGSPKFISHSDLDYQPAKNCQYLLKDTDELYFRISVQVPNNKPWLQCTM